MEKNVAAYYTKIQKQSLSKHRQVKGKCITNPTGISDAFSKSFIDIGLNQKLS